MAALARIPSEVRDKLLAAGHAPEQLPVTAKICPINARGVAFTSQNPHSKKLCLLSCP